VQVLVDTCVHLAFSRPSAQVLNFGILNNGQKTFVPADCWLIVSGANSAFLVTQTVPLYI
jgi:hypothetical protein